MQDPYDLSTLSLQTSAFLNLHTFLPLLFLPVPFLTLLFTYFAYLIFTVLLTIGTIIVSLHEETKPQRA